jgi:CRISPR-associated exonuclease Cas4
MYTDDQLLPISALQHLIFCERQCALIHLERVWAENRLTVEGRHLHQKAHDGKSETTATGVRIARGLWVQSRMLGMVGQTDVVEFHPDGRVNPVEYKRGQSKKDQSDRVQLCAQALCLEEMLKVPIPAGDLFYGQKKRRIEVAFDETLRELTCEKITRLREMIDNHETPPAVRLPKCDNCSLLELCLPNSLRFKQGAAAWNDRQFTAVGELDGPSGDDFEFLT